MRETSWTHSKGLTDEDMFSFGSRAAMMFAANGDATGAGAGGAGAGVGAGHLSTSVMISDDLHGS